MEKKIKIAGVVVLYNPDNQISKRIDTYIEYLDLLVIVDNSDSKVYTFTTPEIWNYKIIYNKNSTNEGLAKALNFGANIAIKNNCDFLLTMDQDSSFIERSFKNLIYLLENINYSLVGIVAPQHSYTPVSFENDKKINEVKFVMTSGNLLNLKIFKIAGGFFEPFFIDHIDHEYGLRLNELGFKVLQTNEVTLKHNLGELKNIKFIYILKIKFVSHSEHRLYYICRNGFYVYNKYKEKYIFFLFIHLKIILKEIFKSVFFEKNTLIRLKYMWKGYIDYKKGKLGKLA